MTILVAHQAVPPTFYNKIAPMSVSTQSTLRGAKHFNIAPTVTSFIHLHTEIRSSERNEDILTRILSERLSKNK